jgi:ubiquinone/menaquinone biosynthesis C-methylase UbiE
MKLNWAEKLAVNNPLRVLQQWSEIRWLKRMIFLKKGALMLEVGCGRGAGARLILKTFQPSILHCSDVDILMVKKAKKYLSAKEQEKICLHVGDAAYLPFENGTVDAVFGFGVLHHVPDWRKALSEIARVLKIGGVYFIEELYPSSYQNFITKHILLHPTHDRFFGHDLRKAMKDSMLTFKNIAEIKKVGILGVAVKEPSE